MLRSVGRAVGKRSVEKHDSFLEMHACAHGTQRDDVVAGSFGATVRLCACVRMCMFVSEYL